MRRFNSYSDYFKIVFGGRAQKISIDAGFTCPNRDGTISTGGCSFCNNSAFNPSYCRPEKSISQQIEEGIDFHRRRYRRAQTYLAYFQPYTNTHKPIHELQKIYGEALSHPLVSGIVVGTRPDCVNEEILNLLGEIKKTHYVMIEYGIESVYDETLRRVNRGHNFATAEKAVVDTAQRGIPCGAHFILGLPGETPQMMLDGIDIISRLPLTTVKFHQLQIFKDTPMADDFNSHPSDYHLFDIQSYIDFIVHVIERLNPQFVIERLAGEVPPRFLVSEPWMSLRYDQVLHLIEDKMEELDTFQGKKFRQCI